MIHSKGKFLLRLGVLVLLLAPLALPTTSAGADQSTPGWHIKTVDSEGDVGQYTSLALDGEGNPHISYYDCGTPDPYCDIRDLKYAYHDASGWHIETVDSEGAVGQCTSLALDGEGYVHISYYDHTNTALKYAYQDESGWHSETVDSGGGWLFVVGNSSSLAMDRDGYPHIGYYQQWKYALGYAWRDASGWHFQSMQSYGESIGSSISLALDESRYPHMSCYGGFGNLKYVYQDAAGWHHETADSQAKVGLYTSLALDRAGYPHIGYYDSTNGSLKYAYQDTSGWHIEAVDSEGDVGRFTSLALDESEYPHISYNDWGNGDLKYVYQDASGWHMETVDSEGVVGEYTSLALDGDGHPHISYYDFTNGDLKYAYYRLPPYHVYLPTILKE